MKWGIFDRGDNVTAIMNYVNDSVAAVEISRE